MSDGIYTYRGYEAFTDKAPPAERRATRLIRSIGVAFSFAAGFIILMCTGRRKKNT